MVETDKKRTEEFVATIRNNVDMECSAKINFKYEEGAFIPGRGQQIKRSYEAQRSDKIMIAYLDINANYGAHAPSSEEVLEDCKGDIKSMMKPYVATFSGTTATITPPKNSLEGKAGEQLELEL